MPAERLPVDVEVRRVRPADWPQLRALRFEALANTPIGYLETLEQALAMPDDGWQARAARGAEGGDSYQVLALAADRPVATTVSFIRDGSAWLAAVYVSPAWRAQGLLATLVGRCAGWARGQGQPELRLEVHEDNARARAAYARLGFVPTGTRTPYPLDPSREELVMSLPL